MFNVTFALWLQYILFFHCEYVLYLSVFRVKLGHGPIYGFLIATREIWLLRVASYFGKVSHQPASAWTLYPDLSVEHIALRTIIWQQCQQQYLSKSSYRRMLADFPLDCRK